MKLSDIFKGNVHSAVDIGFISKPNPDLFLHAAKILNADPCECLVIEDAPNDVEAVKRTEMRCIALTTNSPRKR